MTARQKSPSEILALRPAPVPTTTAASVAPRNALSSALLMTPNEIPSSHQELLAGPPSPATTPSPAVTQGKSTGTARRASREPVDFGIITIREDENDAVLQRFPDKLGTISDHRRYRLRRLRRNATEAYTIAVVRCVEQGNGDAQAAARDLIEDLNPRWILVVGIAGGVPSHEFSLGDVIVSTRIADFSGEAVLSDQSREYALAGGPLHPDAAKLAADIPGMVTDQDLGGWNDEAALGVPLPPVELTDDRLYGDEAWKKDVREKLERRFSPEGARPPRVITGTIGASDRLIKDSEILGRWLKVARQVRAVEMESAGVYRAAHDRSIPFLAIRGISDVVGFKRHPDWTAYACRSAAAFTLSFLRTWPIEPREGSGAEAGPDDTPGEAAEPLGTAASLPSPGPIVGREVLTDRLVDKLLAEPAQPVVVLGPAGIGKSSLTLAALHRGEIVERYGARRWFVRLDAATTAEATVALIAEAIGVRALVDPLRAVRAELARKPSLLLLDNLETPWEGEPSATEEVIAELASTPGIALVASIRGAQSPARVGWGDLIKVKQLKPVVAAKLFRRLVPEHRAGRSEIEALLAPLDGVPLAITLLAQAAEGNDLDNLLKEWERRRTALLARNSTQQDRLSSWKVSVEVSIESKRMTATARRLVAVLSALPDGIAVEDLDRLIDDGSAAARVLAQVGLAFFEEKRLQMLAPIREHVAQEHEPEGADLDRAMEHYGDLARTLGPKTGTLEGEAAAIRLAPETANLDAMIRRGLLQPSARRWIDTALDLAGFSYLSGRSTPSPLEAARAAAVLAGEVTKEARCLVRLGDLAVRRAEQVALEKYEQALKLYRQEGDLLGEASCVRRLGDIAQQRSDLEQAAARYEEALSLSVQAGDVRGRALCIKGLGRLALDRGNYEQARTKYEEALPLFQQVKDVLGEAGSIRRLGDIALHDGDHERARARYEQSRGLCRKVADVLGEAKSILNLGHVARQGAYVEEARERYREAIPLFRRTGSVRHEMECVRCLEELAAMIRESPPSSAH